MAIMTTSKSGLFASGAGISLVRIDTMRMLRLLLLIAMSGAPVQSRSQTLIQLSPHTSIETIASLSIPQIWHSTEVQRAEGKNVSVESRMFDGENRPRQNRLYGCGWLLIGSGDLGSRPVGIRIWSDYQCDLQVSAAADAKPGADEQFSLRIGPREVYDIRVEAEGKVSIGGHDVGAITSP